VPTVEKIFPNGPAFVGFPAVSWVIVSTSVTNGFAKFAWFQMLKEICSKTQRETFRQLEVFLQGEIPLLLERSAIRVASEVAEKGYAGIPGRIRNLSVVNKLAINDSFEADRFG